MTPSDDGAGTQQWPWDRLLVFALGSVSASIGVYIIAFQTFRTAFGLDSNGLPYAYAWGTLLIIVGIFALGAPWSKLGPVAKRWRKDDDAP